MNAKDPDRPKQPSMGVASCFVGGAQHRAEWTCLVALVTCALAVLAACGPSAADLAALKQVDDLQSGLHARNPKFRDDNMRFENKVEHGVVTEVTFHVRDVTDISPVRKLTGLKMLKLTGGSLSDLSPLKDLRLTQLLIRGTQVADLSPLREMKLQVLDCSGTPVSDLSPLKGMALRVLLCGHTRVSNLSPLKDMRLEEFDCSSTAVSDLSPLQGMKLLKLDIHSTQVSDLSPLKDMQLQELTCWSAHFSDLSPLKGMPLTTLNCSATGAFDLSPLQGMKLRELVCFDTCVSDLTPLRGMSLAKLVLDNTRVSDLAPLEGMPLKEFSASGTSVFASARNVEILRSISTLTSINNRPAADFWKGVNSRSAVKKTDAAIMAIDLQGLMGIAELYNMGLSPRGDKLVILGIALTSGGFSHEPWLVDLQQQPLKARKLFAAEADCQFAWSADGTTLLTVMTSLNRFTPIKAKPRYWSTRDAVEVPAPTAPAKVEPAGMTLGPEFSPADKILQQTGYRPGRGWVTAFSPDGAACCPLGGIAYIAFKGRPVQQEGDTDAWWLRFSPDGHALFWVAKNPPGAIYRVTADDTINPQGGSSPQSRLARLDKLFAVGRHGAEVRSATMNAAGTHLFTAGVDGKVQAWNIGEKKMSAEINALEGLPVQASELWGMELSEFGTHLFIYAQPEDKTQRLRPGRAWIKKLDWPAHLGNPAEKATT